MANPQPNIIVMICHDLGQHLGCYGRSDVRSPHIDAFARSAVRFGQSFCSAPQCSPSRAALWTGRFPHANGVIGLTHAGFANDLNPDEKHLAQILGSAGYDTHLFGAQHEARLAERCGHAVTHPAGLCGAIADDFAGFLAARPSTAGPLFAEICFSEPHRPFPRAGVETLPPEEMIVPEYLPDIPEVRRDLALLEASVCSADKAFGKIVEAIRSSSIAGNTVLIFTADHGIAFTHAKMTLYDPGIEVALILWAPGVEEGRIVDHPITNVDLLPTLLDFAGISAPANLHGRSFHALLAGGNYLPNEAVFAEKTYHTYYDPMRAIRTGKWKLIANFEYAPWQETPPDYDNNAMSYVEVSNALKVPFHLQYHPPFELYDLESDPHEQTNLADESEHAVTRDDLIRRLHRWMEETGDPLLEGPMVQAAYRERMRAFREIASPASQV